MHDAVRVDVREAGEHLLHDAESVRDRERTFVEQLAQWLAADEVHHQERQVLVDAVVDHGHAVRMTHPARGLGFDLEALAELGA